MSHLEYKMLFQQTPNYQLLQHCAHFKLPNFKYYKIRSISLCIHKESHMSDNTTTKEIYQRRPNVLYNICPITLQNKA